MDINKLIPNNDQGWIVKGNMIYYHHYCNIPSLQIINDKIWIILDRRSIGSTTKLIKYLTKLNLNFYLNSRKLNNEKDLESYDSKSEVIRNYLSALENDTFFNMIIDGKFDYVENLTKYLLEYDCMEIFKEEYEYCKKRFLSKYIDWYSKNGTIEVYNIKREDKRNFMSGLERQIKLNIFL